MASAALSEWRSQTAMRAPRDASLRAMARPMPRAAPVTMAVRPCRKMGSEPVTSPIVAKATVEQYRDRLVPDRGARSLLRYLSVSGTGSDLRDEDVTAHSDPRGGKGWSRLAAGLAESVSQEGAEAVADVPGTKVAAIEVVIALKPELVLGQREDAAIGVEEPEVFQAPAEEALVVVAKGVGDTPAVAENEVHAPTASRRVRRSNSRVTS